MSAKNFIIKNGLTIGSTEAIDSSGDLTAAAFGTAANEAIDDRVNALLTAGTGISLSYDDSAGTLTITGQQGDITGIVAGAGLTGDASSGEATLNVVGGTGITANANDIEVDTSVVTTLSGTQTLTNKTLTTPIINGTVSGTAIKDEDDMTSNSSTHLASQQSIKAYVDSQVATKDNTDEITEGSSNLYFTNERVDDRVNGLLSAGVNVALSYDDANNDLEIRVPFENIQDTVGAQLVTNGSHTGITASYDDAGDAAIDLAIQASHIRGLISAGGDLSYDNSTGVISFTNDAGDIESVTAGTGLTGGGSSGAVTLNVIGGDGITANANDIALSSTVAGDGLAHASGVLSVNVDDSSIETDSDTLQVKAGGVTNAMLAGSIAAGKLAGSIGNSLLSNSAITIDGTSVSLGGSITTNNTQLTTEEVQDIVGGMVTGNTETGVAVTYEDGDGTLDFVIGSGVITNAMLAGSIANDKLAGSIANAKLANSSITIDGNSVALGGSVTTNNTQLTQENVEDFVGGMLDGTETGISVSYDDTNGNLDFVVADSDFALTGDVTGTATQTAKGNVSISTSIANNSVDLTTHTTGNYVAGVSAGTGVSVSGSGSEGATATVSIGQAVGTSDSPTFDDLTVSGNLTVNGSTVTNSATNTTIEDQLIELGTGNSGSASGDAGIVIERGSDANVFMGWDESADAITFGTGTFTGASSGNLTITPSAVNTGAITITNATNSGGTARNIYQSTSAPGSSDGAVGDLWILYS